MVFALTHFCPSQCLVPLPMPTTWEWSLFSRLRCSDIDLELPKTLPGWRGVHVPRFVQISPAIWPTNKEHIDIMVRFSDSLFTYLLSLWHICSVTMTRLMTTARSVSSVCVSLETLWYCRVDTCVCATAALTTCATRPTIVRYVAPSSTHCCKCVPFVTRRQVGVWLVHHVWRRPPWPADHQWDECTACLSVSL